MDIFIPLSVPKEGTLQIDKMIHSFQAPFFIPKMAEWILKVIEAQKETGICGFWSSEDELLSAYNNLLTDRSEYGVISEILQVYDSWPVSLDKLMKMYSVLVRQIYAERLGIRRLTKVEFKKTKRKKGGENGNTTCTC